MVNQIFCVHAGLSPECKTFDQIREIDRFVFDFSAEGPLCDFVWSDPEDIEDWANNYTRGAGWIFG